ncbi:MAG TPA: PAS domain S-box protein [Bacteriovoracaceae bacterium]|nr:PAS domain S-box protein [Bacteriovoracaceae bacterium]
MANLKKSPIKSNEVKLTRTEQKRTLKHPKATAKQMGSLEKFRRMATVIQDSNDAITFQDLDGNILAWNRGAETMYGYSEAEALRMNIVDTVPHEYQEQAREFLASLKRGELVPNLETKRKHKDGRIIDVWLTNTKLTDDKGKLTGIATTERDISERMGALEKFRRMATVIQDSNDAITFQDLDGNILAWNRGAETMYGYSESEALRMNIVDTVPHEYQEQARDFLASLKRGELVPTRETKRKHKDGRIIDVWLTNTKLTDDKGKFTGIATTERDISERMGALEKFRRMATVIQDSNDAITFQNLEGNILAWNKGAENMYGYSEAEALRMNIVDTVPHEYQEQAREFLASLKRGELVPNLETKRKHKDGRIIDVWLTNTKLTDEKGKLTGIATTERDISQRKRAEASQYARSLIEASLDPLVTISSEGKITDVNEGSIKVTGVPREKLVGTDFSDYFTEPEKARDGYRQVFSMGFVTDYPLTIRHLNGKLTDVLYNASVYKDVHGNVLGVFAAARDVTQQKQLEFLTQGQIALSEKMRGEQVISRLGQSILSHLVPFTNAQIGSFYVVTDDKKLQMVSGYALPKVETLDKFIEFGQGLIGQVAIEKKSLLIEDVPPSYFSKIGSSFGELVPRSLLICPILYENEITGVIELGSLQPFTEHQRAFLSHVSENIGIAINTSDVRNKVQKQNEELNKAQVLLEEKANEVQRASQYKTEFLANMSHELRTPLNSSLILAKLLMENSKDNLTEEQIQYATSIYSSGKDLLNLINDILDLSKVEAGKLDIRVEKVVILNVIEGLKQTFQSLAQEKKLILEVSHETDMPPSFQTDRQRLDQILKNLISNALKFTEKGSVKIRLCNHSKGHIAFEVSDTGIGIPKEQHAIIFEAFRQADGTTNRKYGGTGLGLSISRDLAKLLGGSIEVESAAGKGSRFTLILPEILNESSTLAGPSAESPSQQETSSYRHFEKSLPTSSLPFEDDRTHLATEGRTVLVIDDDVKFDKILLDVAHELKYKCIVAQGADEGFDLALEYDPDAIILDMKLPDHLGLTVLDRLKENPKTRHIPVQVMSTEDYSKAAIHMGAIGFMLKPVNYDEIKNAFKKLEARFSKNTNRVLIVEDDELQRKSIAHLIADDGIEITTVGLAQEAIIELKNNVFDCMIMDLKFLDLSGVNILEQMNTEEISSFPPVIVYKERPLSKEQEDGLENLSKSIIIKGVRSPERLLDEVNLILHRSESKISQIQRRMIQTFRSREQIFKGKKILLVDDDIRNIFALTSVLEQKGATVVAGKNGQEALDKLNQDPQIDLVLMDIMMPEMDGYEATRRIRQQKRFAKLPIIAVTAKVMKDDLEKCLEAGTNDYVSKPVDLEKLFSLIRVWAPQLEQYS